ncbi:MAG: penicillin-binding protein 2 [Candidatus Doudnabacteria bacterium]|nr:penicillin-binding protein 2 [Candidatus Doudnabacteria bacterium]
MSPFEINTNVNSKRIRSDKDLSFDEILFDVQLDETETMESDRDSVNYRFLAAVLFLCFVVLFGRIYYLQAMKGSDYRVIAEGNKLRSQYILAPRGLMLDRNGKIIVSNLPSFELVVTPTEMPENEADLSHKLSQIAELSGAPLEELKATVSQLDRKSPHSYTLVQNLAKDPALILISRKDEFNGFAVQNNPIRDYKDPFMYSHLVGYTGKITSEELVQHEDQSYLLNDYIGKNGLEFEYEQYLRGVPGSSQTEINAQGTFNKDLPEIPANPGNNLKLNVDSDLQKVIFDSTTAMMKKINAKSAAVIATNPQTGQVLAFLSLPGYDGNMFARGIKNIEYAGLINDPAVPLLNRVVTGTYPPGSTVKPMVAIAALSEGIVTPQTTVVDDGVIRVGSYTYYGYRREGLGVMNIYSAIARSSDIYFYTVGGGSAKSSIKEGLGPDRLALWFRNFNLGGLTQIDLPNEKTGLVPDTEWKERVKKEPWYLGNTYHYSIGQGDLLATPLQINNATATIANGGRIMKPYLVDEVVAMDGGVILKNNPKVLRENFIDSDYVKVVQDGMRMTITEGSGRALATLPIEIAGKTGTSQFDARDLSRTHAWFTAYGPFKDPKIALTVLIEAGGEGSSVAVPIAKDVFSWWAQNRSN